MHAVRTGSHAAQSTWGNGMHPCFTASPWNVHCETLMPNLAACMACHGSVLEKPLCDGERLQHQQRGVGLLRVLGSIELLAPLNQDHRDPCCCCVGMPLEGLRKTQARCDPCQCRQTHTLRCPKVMHALHSVQSLDTAVKLGSASAPAQHARSQAVSGNCTACLHPSCTVASAERTPPAGHAMSAAMHL